MDKLTPEQLKQLEQLKDIHLPEPISWWPIAIGWWLILALLIIVIISFVLWSKRAARLVKKDALSQLQMLETNNSTQFAGQLSALLKRVGRYCNVYYQGKNLETLTGREWQSYLKNNGFAHEQADFIANAPYTNQSDSLDINMLKHASTKWISQQFKKRKKS